MSALSTLQNELQAYVLRGKPAIAARVRPGRLRNQERRLAIYFDAYRSRLIDALATDFDALKAAMGEDDFRAACRAYVEAHPSVFRNVRWYGAGLADFLRDHRGTSTKPWLAEIARFEWTLTLVFDAPDEPPLSFEQLAKLPAEAWTTVRFRLHPSAQLLNLSHNAPAFRRAVEAGHSLPSVERADAPVPWLVWRKDWSPHFRSLGDGEAWALHAVQDAQAFPNLCEGLCAFVPEEQAAALAATWLRGWVDDQLVCGLEPEGPPPA